MKAKVSVKANQESDEILRLIKSAVDGEIARLELALEMAHKRLQPFEKKYKITSDDFISNMTGEDLENGDEDYVTWAGEYQLKKRLEKKLDQLEQIEYDDPELLR